MSAAGVQDALVVKVKDAKLVSSAYQSRAMFAAQWNTQCKHIITNYERQTLESELGSDEI